LYFFPLKKIHPAPLHKKGEKIINNIFILIKKSL